jgi:hypothetical protein
MADFGIDHCVLVQSSALLWWRLGQSGGVVVTREIRLGARESSPAKATGAADRASLDAPR